MDARHQLKRVADVAGGMRAAKALAEREQIPHNALAGHRQARLDDLARHAMARSPFWRERLRDALGRDGSLELSAVAPLTKRELMEHWDDAVTDRRLRRDEVLEHLDGLDRDALWLGEYRAMTTSGSSGLKGLFVYDRAAWRGLLAQFFRYNAWVGVKPRLPRRLRIAAIGGGRPTHMSQRVAATIDVGAHRVLPLAVTASVTELVDALNAFQPEVLNCYPSIAALLADEQAAGRLSIRLTTMSTSSELRTAEVTDRIRSAFGVRPFDLFATTEGLWGSECREHAGVHLFDDMCLVENVDADGRPVPDGERGDRLLVTNLFNRAQPLFRFELTDVAAFAPEPCPCGRTLRRLKTLDGRTDDVLRLPSANGAPVPVHPMQFGVVTADPAVREFQVVGSADRLRLRLVLRAGADRADACRRVRARICDRLSAIGVDGPDVEIELRDALERSPSGKLQQIVSDAAAT